jgi:hypothetical protein
VQFIDALREMPLLEDILFGFRDLQLNSPPIVSESLEMPCLQRLGIKSGCSSVIREFLLSTTFPRLQKATIGCLSNDNNDANDYSPIINATLSLVTRGDFGRFDHVEFDANRFMMSQLSPPDWKSKRTLELTCPRTKSGRLTVATMAGISALPGDRTSDFVLVVLHARLASQNLTDLFRRLPRLESLRAYICSEVIESLKVPPLHSIDLPIPVPRLEKLTLDEGRILYNTITLKELRDSLMTRRNYESEVKELCLNCQLMKEEAPLLQEAVVDLDFWGYTESPRVIGVNIFDLMSDLEEMDDRLANFTG